MIPSIDRRLIALSLLLASVGLAFAPVVRSLIADWSNDDNYSHGFFIVPLALYFAWERRERLARTPVRPSALGLAVVLASLGVLVAGTLGVEFFLTRVALLGVIAGTVLFMLGWGHLRILALPIAFLLLMIPLPSIVFNQIAFPLQLFASRFGTAALQACAVPVLREGNVIVLASTELQVAEACSGIRSLISLLTLGIVYGYFVDSRTWVRAVLALSTIPIAIVSNGLRVAGTGIAAHFYGPEAAQGFFHTFSGWLVFLVAFVLLLAVHAVVQRLSPNEVEPPLAQGSPGVAA